MKYYGNLAALKPQQRYILLRQLHKARRAGLHTDVRIGAPQLGLFSWAAPKDLPTVQNQKRLLITQPLHTYEYKDFQGTLKTKYGQGTVKKLQQSPIIILQNSGDKIKFKRDTQQNTPVYTMIRTKNGNWITTMNKSANVYTLSQQDFKKQKIRKALAALALKLDKDHIEKYNQDPFQSQEQQKKAQNDYTKWIKKTKRLKAFVDSPKDPKAMLMYYPSNHIKGSFHLGTFYIQPQLRGKGLGSSLMEQAQKQAKIDKVKKLIISWNAQNKDAQRLYLRKGYRPLATTGIKELKND